MSRYVQGADEVMAKIKRLSVAAPIEVAAANHRSGEELIRIARILHPGDGSTKAQITGTANANGSYLADFGDKAKVTEGRSGPRPFVNPALNVTRKKHRNRARRALRKAVQNAFA